MHGKPVVCDKGEKAVLRSTPDRVYVRKEPINTFQQVLNIQSASLANESRRQL